MKAVLKPEDTPYFEGVCDLNGDPVREEENESSAEVQEDREVE